MWLRKTYNPTFTPTSHYDWWSVCRWERSQGLSFSLNSFFFFIFFWIHFSYEEPSATLWTSFRRHCLKMCTKLISHLPCLWRPLNFFNEVWHFEWSNILFLDILTYLWKLLSTMNTALEIYEIISHAQGSITSKNGYFLNYTHEFKAIRYLYHSSLDCRRGAGVNPSWYWARGVVHPGQLIITDRLNDYF